MPGSEYLKSRWRSIQIALEGIKQVLTTQQNTWIHAGFSLAVILFGFLLDISRLEWMVLLLVIGFVWAAEMFNTAIEILTDHISPEENPTIKIIKDISAGGVLISAMISVLVGLLLFGPRLWSWISHLILIRFR